jgi:hypothetical protein
MPNLLVLDPQLLRTAVTLIAITGLLALNNRRLIIVPLLVQYVLVASLVSYQIAEPLFAIRLTLGGAIAAILYITANRLESLREDPASPALAGGLKGIPLVRGMGATFRLLALALGALLAFGFWSGTSFSNLASPLSLTALWLGAVGLCLLIVSTDPLHIGIGLLIFVNGVEAIYLSLESSLLVVASLGLVDILIALAIAYISENWIESISGEARA